MGNTTASAVPLRHDWVAKILAGTLLGFTLGLGCSGLFIHLAAGLPMGAKAQLAMWLVVPVWLGVLSLVFLFRTGLRAWLWLGGANLAVFGALAAFRFL